MKLTVKSIDCSIILDIERGSGLINEYSFSQVTLEQLFIELVNKSEIEDAD